MNSEHRIKVQRATMKEGFFESKQQVHIIDDNKYRAAV